MELKDQDVKHIYKWMGKTSQSLKNLESLYNGLATDIKEDRKERIELEKVVSESKGERKYIYGMIIFLYAAFVGSIVKGLKFFS